MKISIVTACFNPGKTMPSAVNSVIGQNHSELQYIIIDGGSTDGTVEYIRSQENRISHFQSEPDRGVYDALNKGVRMANGEVVGFLHADDMYFNCGVLSRVADAFKRNRADAVYGDLVYVARDKTDKIIRYWKSGLYAPGCLRRGGMPPHPTFFLRREIYERALLANGEYFDTSLKIAADYDFIIRILMNMQIELIYLPSVLVKMRVGGKSNKSIRNIILKSREDYIVMKRHSVGGFYTLLAKNFRKIPQLLGKRSGRYDAPTFLFSSSPAGSGRSEQYHASMK